MITHRPRRLDGVSYAGFQRYFVTSCTSERHRAFENADVTEWCTAQLRTTAAAHQFAIAAYCFMPDHVHLLLYGTSETADLRRCVARYKQLTGFEYRKRQHRLLWQPGYHERVLRDEEATDPIARYILANPIRAGLTEKWGEYPFAGSDLFDYRQG
jgi:putative transposase